MSILSRKENGDKMNTDSDYIDFSEVARKQCGMIAQYCREYLIDPIVGKDIRWQVKYGDYHFIVIHKDDVEEFSKRVRAAQKVKFPWKK